MSKKLITISFVNIVLIVFGYGCSKYKANEQKDFTSSDIACLESLNQEELSQIASQEQEIELVSGKVRHLIKDYSDGSYGEEYFLESNDKTYKLHFSDSSQKQRIPLNKEVRLAVNKSGEEEYQLYSKDSQIYFECMISKSSTGLNNKNIGVYYIAKPGTDVSQSKIDNLHDAAKEVKDYYTIIGRDHWTVDAKAHVIYSDCPPVASNGCVKEIKKFNEENGLDHNYFVIAGGFKSGLCGEATLRGKASYTYGCGTGTMIHEIGHNFGLNHASTPSSEYGDSSSVMGSSGNKNLFNSPQLVHLNLHAPEGLIEIDKNQKVFLAPIEWHSIDLYSGEYQHAVVQKEHEGEFYRYYISTRKSPGAYTVNQPGVIYVHKFEGLKSIRISKISEGDEIILSESDIKIRHRGIKNGVVEVDILYHANGIEPKPQAYPSEPQAPIMVGQAIEFNHQGLWFDPFTSGQGFDLQVLHERNEVVLYWYTYSQNDTPSRQRYYIGQGEIINGVAELSLITTSGGIFAETKEVDISEIGEAKLYFESCSKGILEYNTVEHGRGHIPLYRLAGNSMSCNGQVPNPKVGHNPNGKTDFFQSGLAGSWYDPDFSGHGFSINVLEDSQTISAFWYTYDLKGKQKWYMLDGSYTEGDPKSLLTIYETSDGYFKHPKEVDIKPWGTAELILKSCSKMELKYQKDNSSINGSFLLSRITPNVHCTNEKP